MDKSLTERQKELILHFAENDMNLSATSRNCYMAYKTIQYHLGEIEEKTGLNPRCLYDLVELVEMVKGTTIISEAKQEADRKRLRELICYGLLSCDPVELADFLVANGVTVKGGGENETT